MKKLTFSFSTKLTFDDNIYNHSFALRCVPFENNRQKILDCRLDIKPFVSVSNSVDAFGNNVTTGYISKKHRYLDFEINGIAQIDNSQKDNDYLPCYLFQSEYTKPDKELVEFYCNISKACSSKSPFERAAYYSDRLFNIFKYQKNSTNTETKAKDAFKIKSGVCQDYSHIMLSVLRLNKIPCRYIAGLSGCDGETHSWIEVWNDGSWIGFDPTNNCPANDDYLALTKGRDFGDCAIDRGVMFGSYTKQMQLISSRLEQQ